VKIGYFKIIVVGGKSSNIPQTQTEVVNLQKPLSSCTDIPDYPLAVGNPRSVLLKNGTLLVCGGFLNPGTDYY